MTREHWIYLAVGVGVGIALAIFRNGGKVSNA